MKLIGRGICFFKGHKRGKLHRQTFVDSDGPKVAFYRCPRCDRETRYRIKPPAPNGSEPGDQS